MVPQPVPQLTRLFLLILGSFQAYSLVDREVGYCQGSAFIVGLLLMQVCAGPWARSSCWWVFNALWGVAEGG